MHLVALAAILCAVASGCTLRSSSSHTDAGAASAAAPSTAAAAASTAAPVGAATHAAATVGHADAGAETHGFVPPNGPDRFGIGGGESDAHTHVSFTAPKDLVRASVNVVVDRFAPHGLNFFALQVNWKSNHTWAHGGFQTHTENDAGVPAAFNWCGLVDRGGGSKDYKQADPKADLDFIECASPDAANWHAGVPYEYAVERGQRITLPAGEYGPKATGKKYKIDHPRTMWEWWFTVTPLGGGTPIYKGLVYDSAETISSFIVWNENGYGSQATDQHTTWWGAKCRTAEAPTADQAPSKWSRF